MTNAERAAEEKRLEKRARRIGRLETYPSAGPFPLKPGCPAHYADLWSADGQSSNCGEGKTRLAALRDLMRLVDRFADKVIASREGE